MAKILYIEDHKLIREATELLLVNMRHSVIARANTDKADAIIDQWDPDLVITDHNLGHSEETGLELAKRLKEDGRKVVVLSGCPVAAMGAEEEGIPFFYKPCSMATLLKSMEVES